MIYIHCQGELYTICVLRHKVTHLRNFTAVLKRSSTTKNVKLGTAKENLTEMKKYRRQAYECDGFMSTLQLLYQCEHVSGCVMAGLN